MDSVPIFLLSTFKYIFLRRGGSCHRTQKGFHGTKKLKNHLPRRKWGLRAEKEKLEMWLY